MTSLKSFCPEEADYGDEETIVHSVLDLTEFKTLLHQSYIFVNLLGSGGSGEVYLVYHKTSKKQFACKIICRNHRMNHADTMKLEYTLMKQLHHRNVLTLHEVYETAGGIALILEYANGGDLMHVLPSLPHYNERTVARLFKQILLAVKYLHSQGIVHRDLKMKNILFSYFREEEAVSKKENDKDDEEVGGIGEVKIADFGLSAQINHQSSKSSNENLKNDKSLGDKWGTFEYMAPEVHQRAYGMQADIWSLGCVLYEMLTGEIAFPYKEGIFRDIVETLRLKSKRRFEKKIGWKVLSSEARSLIMKMLKRNPAKRYDIDECLNHPWITGERLITGQTHHHHHHHHPPAELFYAKRIIRRRLHRRQRKEFRFAFHL